MCLARTLQTRSTWALFGAAAVALVGCELDSSGPGPKARDDSETLADGSVPILHTSFDAGPAADSGFVAEVCDGWDNDGDGLVDEGTGGDRCAADGGDGTLICARGRLECLRCRPGETKREACGCGQDRVDTCNESSRWVLGTCDGCPAAYTPTGCDRVGACKPGETEYRPCDLCLADAGSCGTSCVGSRWACSQSCDWVQTGACEVRNNPECVADQTSEEACGACGTRQVRCDGCFRVKGPCRDQGACNPGQTLTVPCFSGACAAGHVATVTCSGQCSWSSASACRGCTLGAKQDTSTDCVAGHPACGAKVTRAECVGSPTNACGGQTATSEGKVVTSVVSDVCPQVECTPGVVQDLGACACPTFRRTRTCEADCRWKVSECPAPVCQVGATRAVACTQYQNASSTETCGTCGWNSGAACVGNVSGLVCQCTPGQTQSLSQSCGPTNGCKSRTVSRTCVDCRWQETQGACTQPAPCTTASNAVTQVSCGANTCGKTYARTTTCDLTNSCSLVVVNDLSTCPTCNQGATRTNSCTTGSGACGSQTQTCSATCTWGTANACQASASSCTPGQTKVESCTTDAVTLCGVPGNRTMVCSPSGCGWQEQTSCAPIDANRCLKGSTKSFGTCACGNSDSRSCDSTCNWGPSSCGTSCTAGAVVSQPCVVASLCNAPGHKQVTCASSSCGWVDTSACVPDDPTRCQPGTTKSVLCQDQGTKTITCGSTCAWPGCN